ncbi:MAG: flavodoxin-dependent (E)-4-hydroxy-3-methylbut-2-enyl-diphosphate synthase [Spirochaetales bacterium]|uniref:4-hydroxy-3-methylbut-2-en-1-yl diphosphate synthase (flavodoxin) n=1 Tax=Candidatus Thalassospirochaeta sargassi TaxID=3119039 RepID=A0AAJ1MP36_9SPIO|nr:flavodoxin-dependent (E)-4-hydroxy-3-methylbut-2-enyl-diphosphate synthase [Spirochaetales bacterium]
MTYKTTRKVRIGNIEVGGDSRKTVQTMWKKSLDLFSGEDLEEILNLEDVGCDILRFSVPNFRTAGILAEIKRNINMPLVADIHFDYKIALECIKNGIDKIRINPGNIGDEWKVKEVLQAAADKNIPIRIGINTGSLDKTFNDISDKAEAMLKSAESEINILEKYNFTNALFSLKSSDIESTLRANREFSRRWDYPLHLGVTEAGPLTAGLVKSSIAISQMLNQGIGDTIRVSLTDKPIQEVIAGREILRACGMYANGVDIVSCPRCGRSTFDTHEFISSVYDELYRVKKNLKVAVMGCIVNGPGEASDADIGITGAGTKVVIFKHGKIYRKVDENKGREEFLKVLEEFVR